MSAWRRVRSALQRAARLHDEFFVSKWRSGLAREAARQEDAFLALVYLESMGVESPAGYYLLEAYPDFLERFHQWHRRMGVDRLDSAGACC